MIANTLIRANKRAIAHWPIFYFHIKNSSKVGWLFHFKSNTRQWLHVCICDRCWKDFRWLHQQNQSPEVNFTQSDWLHLNTIFRGYSFCVQNSMCHHSHICMPNTDWTCSQWCVLLLHVVSLQKCPGWVADILCRIWSPGYSPVKHTPDKFNGI